MSAAVLASAGACRHAPTVAPEYEWESPERAQAREQSATAARTRFFGVDVVRMSRAAFVVRINSSMVGRGDPLYVIDGAPIIVSPRRGVDWIQLEDIARIKVLKSPEDLAVYGPQGVNGVIVITTKQASRHPRE